MYTETHTADGADCTITIIWQDTNIKSEVPMYRPVALTWQDPNPSVGFYEVVGFNLACSAKLLEQFNGSLEVVDVSENVYKFQTLKGVELITLKIKHITDYEIDAITRFNKDGSVKNPNKDGYTKP